MKLNITARNFDVSDYLKEVISKKFEKLEKFFDKDIKTDIRISAESGIQKMEATIYANGTIFRAEEKSTDIYSTIESVTGKLDRQIVKYKNKLKDKHKSGGINFDIIQDVDQKDEIQIVRTKKVFVKPMDAIEAALQMNLLDHNFFVYRDGDTEEIAIVYKRRDGKVGLIEPYND